MENKSFSKWAKEISEQEYAGMLCPNCLTRMRVRVTDHLVVRHRDCAILTDEQWEAFKDWSHQDRHKHEPRKDFMFICKCPVGVKFYDN